MNTADIKDDFYKAESKVNDVSSNGDLKLCTAIFQGLKLIALAIIYHANNK